MRIFTRIIPLLVLGILLAGFATPAKAEFNPFGDIKLPEVTPPDWKVGQSVTYNINIDGIPDLGKMDGKLRVAIVGEETIEGKPFYWVEYDVSDLQGLPPEASGMFSELKVKFLVVNIPPEKMNNDPKAMLEDLAAGKLLRKIVFQIDDQTPQMLDMMTIQGMVQGMTGQSLEEMLEDMPMDEMEEEGMPEGFKMDTGKETVTVPAGTFTNAGFVHFEYADDTGGVNGKVHAHETVPIGAFLKMAMDIDDKNEGVNMKVNIELAEHTASGAKSKITGTPQPFDFSQFFGAMSGGMGGMQ